MINHSDGSVLLIFRQEIIEDQDFAVLASMDLKSSLTRE